MLFGRKENNSAVIRAKNGLGAEGLVELACALEKVARAFPNVTMRIELEGWNEKLTDKSDDGNNQCQSADNT